MFKKNYSLISVTPLKKFFFEASMPVFIQILGWLIYQQLPTPTNRYQQLGYCSICATVGNSTSRFTNSDHTTVYHTSNRSTNSGKILNIFTASENILHIKIDEL